MSVDWETDRQTDRQTDKQTERVKMRMRERKERTYKKLRKCCTKIENFLPRKKFSKSLEAHNQALHRCTVTLNYLSKL